MICQCCRERTQGTKDREERREDSGGASKKESALESVKKKQAQNGVTFAKPTSPNWGLIPNLIAISTFLRNVVF